MTHRSRPDPTRRAWLAFASASAAAAVAALLISTGPTWAAVPPAAYDTAFQQFQRAAAGGDASTIESAADQFDKLAASEPADPVLLAYSGAATAMRATTTMLPWRKMGFAEDGLAQIDKALAMLAPQHDTLLHHGVPATLEARFVAATTFLRLPSMFNRHARGVRLLDEVAKHPLLAGAPAGFRAAVAKRKQESQ
ncbi:MAG TPA: hypothetical protein VGP22_09125 [Albitalea sp.]|nr:hypothetical protein [Albitalea sp.]